MKGFDEAKERKAGEERKKREDERDDTCEGSKREMENENFFFLSVGLSFFHLLCPFNNSIF